MSQARDPMGLLPIALAGGERPLLIFEDGQPALRYADVYQLLTDPTVHAQESPSLVGLIAAPARASFERLLLRIYLGFPTLLLHPRLLQREQDELLARAKSHSLHPEALLLLATSGSTAAPKIVQHGAANLRSAIFNSLERVPLQPDDSWLLSLPYAHIGGLMLLLRSLLSQITVTVAKRATLSSVRKLKPTLASLVPTQLTDWLNESHDLRSLSLRLVVMGGAPMSESLLARASKAGLTVLASYGLTESASQIATEALPGGGLLPLPTVELRLNEGVLQIRSPQMMLGYLGAPALAREEFFNTGDRAELNPTLKILGRSDAVIISGGENISPEAVELAIGPLADGTPWLLSSIPDERWGERAIAVVESSASSPQKDALLSELSQRAFTISSILRPKGVVFVDKIPRTNSGKWARSQTRTLLAQLSLTTPPRALKV